ncbi:MAG: multicopper oxidase domain-containing protein [Ktedonobacteraceae bacterium]|nr:multicopper oxidase domain-containing protein [Chloroflexota bacterium]
MLNRRQFLARTAAVGAGLAVPWYFDRRAALAFYQSAGLQKFAQPLRGVGPGGIPVAAADAFPAPVTGVTHYSFTIGQFTDQLHPNLGPTTMWGYNPVVALGGGVQPQRHLGGIIVAQRGVPIQLTFTNTLPPKHILPVDTSTNFPNARKHQNATVTHLHGGFVPWISDGGPLTWYTPEGHYGPSVHSAKGNIYKLLNPGLKPGQAEHYYPNDQSARLAWYHDHAQDITRLNAYAGIASAYIIRDSFEGHLRNKGLPDFVENGGHEIPIVIQDKIFVGPDILTKDPTWTGLTGVGSLWYPHTYETDRWELGEHPLGLPPDPSIIPEMFGDTMLANGTVYPEATIEARHYRLRVLNACQARFLNLQLYVDDGSPDGITLDPRTMRPTNAPGPDFLVIGTEGGFLPHPVHVPANRPFNPNSLDGSLVTAPAERWDLIIDFKGFAGKKIILYNDAPAPFPMGDPLNDYFPGAPGNPTQPQPGFGPNTRQILRFKVSHATGKDVPLCITEDTDLKPGLNPFLVPPGTAVQNGVLHLPPGVPVRQLTLNETFDDYGRLLQLLGTNQPIGDDFGRAYMDPATETPRAGATEVWQIANLTGDTHPIHFHLVNVQVLARQPFNVEKYNGTPSYTGPARGPGKTERGWKETVRMHPGDVTSVIMRFDLPAVPFSVPPSPRTGGHEYVWHCHILDHEEHDMMRPLVVM